MNYSISHGKQRGIGRAKKGTRIVAILLSLLLVVGFMSGTAVSARTISAGEKQVHDYLTNQMDFNEAAASGILANIYYESNFNPHLLGDYYRGVPTSYGICQWHNDRKTKLVNYCKKYGYDYTTIEGQLRYLEYELKRDFSEVYGYLKNVPNTAEGAYNAGHYWCYWFEKPKYRPSVSIVRGRLAKNTYWKTYGTDNGSGSGNGSSGGVLAKTISLKPEDCKVSYSRVLKVKSTYMTGSDVKYMQVCLKALGYTIDTDGCYGSNTAAVVKKFQKDNNLSADGACGSETWKAIEKAVAAKNTAGTTPPTTTTAKSTTTTTAASGKKLSITKQPEDVVAASGSKATFTVTATGEGLKYQWQYSCNGGQSWANSTVKTNSYATTLTQSNSGRLLRCVVTDKNGASVTSNAAGMTVATSNLRITAQPANVSGYVDEKATLSLKASGTGLSYQWYYKKSGESKFTKWSGKTGAKVDLTVYASWHGTQYYCEVKDSAGKTVKSDTVKLTVLSRISEQPKNVSGKVGDVVNLSVKATGAGLSYQWYYKKSGESKFTKWSGKTGASVKMTVYAGWHGAQYYCEVKDSAGKVLKSNTVSEYVAPAITQQPADSAAAMGEKVSFRVKTSGGDGVTYRWQLSDNQGKKWYDSSVTKAEYYATLGENNDGRMVRCVVTDAKGNTVISQSAKMTVKR